MTAVSAGTTPRRGPNYKLREWLAEAAAILLGLVVVVWTLAPIYNMVMVALESHNDIFTSDVFPADASAYSFWVVFTEGYWYLEYFWHQYLNSLYIGFWTVFLTLMIGSMVSYSIGRMRIKHGWLLTNAALLTYLVPAAFLAIPLYRLMQSYGLGNNVWSIIAVAVDPGLTALAVTPVPRSSAASERTSPVTPAFAAQ